MIYFFRIIELKIFSLDRDQIRLKSSVLFDATFSAMVHFKPFYSFHGFYANIPNGVLDLEYLGKCLESCANTIIGLIH